MNLKPTFVLLSFLLASTACVSQSRWEIEFTPGIAIPIGKFSGSAQDQNSSKLSGNARTALSADLIGYLSLNDRYGFLLTTGIRLNSPDEKAIKRRLESSGNQASVNTDNWKAFKVLGGGWFKLFSDERKLVVRLSIQGGVVKTAIPAIRYTTYNASTSQLAAFYYARQPLPAAACLETGVRVGRKIGEHWAVSLGSNVFLSGPETTVYFSTGSDGPIFSPGPIVSPEPRRVKVPLNSLNITGGLSFQF